MARKLRREQGLPLNKIARRVGASKSSVSLWVRDIELTPEQHEALHGADALHYRTAKIHYARSVTFRQRRIRWQIEGRVTAMSGDPFHAAGCMLFWAEGSKARNHAAIVNADPEVIRLFARFLRRYFDTPNEQFRVACNLFADHLAKREEIEDFWLDIVGVPRSCLTKTMVNRYSRYSQKKRANKLPYGTCRVTLHSTRIAQHLYGAIQQYGGFDRPEWLD